MASENDTLDAIVVGAGWAGLGVSYYLTQAGLRHRVLERGQISMLASSSTPNRRPN
jgi:putative flavoprotein involved in K+ transport